MKISPFTPLHFREANESDGLPSRYIQTWAPTDQILIQVIADVGDTAPAATLNNAHTGASLGPIEFLEWQMNTEKEVIYESADLDSLEPAYCLSVHKSQGSEFPVVVMPVIGGPPMLLTRNLLYTAMTRARELVVLVGNEDVIRRMVENDHVAKRYTTLALRLQETEALGN